MHPRRLLALALPLALLVIVLGSYTRLTHAGLGCPDWPGCYGQALVPSALAADPVAHGRAWTEMVHRYAAGSLGLVVLALAWAARRAPPPLPRLALVLTGLVLFQAALGMWTVTLRLLPLVVMAHLLGGLAILGLLWWAWLGRGGIEPRPLAWAALLALVLQIGLGGWTSANYAALACPDLPTCQGAWWPEADFGAVLSLPPPLGTSYEGGTHDGPGRIAIHLSHRLGALLAFSLLGLLAWRRWRQGGDARRAGLALGLALALQITLGFANVLLRLPLPVAVAHTGGAALLLLATLTALRAESPATKSHRARCNQIPGRRADPAR